MTPQMSKQEFEAYCNKHVQACGNDGWGKGSGPKTSLWGTWCRRADREYFNEMYRQYTETGVLPS